MSSPIINGIQLPAFDVEMLSLGKLIVVPFVQFQKEGRAFWLYPSQNLPLNLSLEEYYQPEYLNRAKSVFAKYKTHPFHIQAWARCEQHWRINSEQKHFLSKIARATVWNLNALELMFDQYQVIKMLILRVYRLSTPCIINSPTDPGAFFWPKPEDSITTVCESNTPVLYKTSFNKRKALLVVGKDYEYTSLEIFQFQCEEILDKNPEVQQLNYDIKQILGWTSEPPSRILNTNLNWINDIAALGDRSKEHDEGRSNYQAGTDFENIVRKSLEFLGFTVDYFHKGGAGGVDVFCSKPYPLVGECKAGKKIPNPTAVQLLNLGTLRLKSPELFKQSAKLIIGPGEPTTQLKDAAIIHGMAIINPKTLEQLVKLHSNYPGSVDLFKLKEHLKPGSADDEIEKYIQLVYKTIKLRSHLVQLVKKHQENTGDNNVEVATLFGAYGYSNPPQSITREEMHEILLELSSPLTGYLGRIKGSDWKSDRFYFLRDLPIVYSVS
ncbi:MULTISPECIES: DUF1802 family protein [Nostocales]|uniref:DUF1802 family protein n=3 Tax=Nostocales TaxID=1161 RepID=A0A0C1MZ01_9CYAN|nr:DUF1802 family protein [Tolypothrix bouteillei]KAF3888962.1 DUF1802 family protein [Tolypothrix bouteillei VB521301]